MKITYIFTLCFIFSLKVCSQSFGGSDSEWVYDYNGFWSKGITQVVFEKDTIIDSRKTKKFLKYATRINPRRDTFNYLLNPIYYHNQNGIVEFSIDLENFDTLFNLQAQIGKSWKIFFGGDSMELTVLDTFRTDINNIEVFSQSVKYDYSGDSSYFFVDTVFEHIGSKWSYILPWDFMRRAADGGEGGLVRCFKNDELGIVSFSSKYVSIYEFDCAKLATSNGKVINNSSVKGFPNPTSDDIKIVGLEQFSKIELKNIFGKSIKINDSSGEERFIDLTNVPAGVYFLLINNVTVQKIIKN